MERNQVETKYKWKITDLFETDEDWERAFAEADGLIDFSEFAGRLGDKRQLLAMLKKSDELSRKIERVFLYASMKSDEDKRISKYTAYDSKCAALYSRYSAAMAFFEPEMAAQSEDYIKSLIADKDFSDYDYMLSLLLKRKKHVIPEEQEKLVAMAGETFGTFSDIFSMIDNADLPLPEIEFEGQKIKLTHGTYAVILRSGDREKRREAYEKYYGAYESLINTITATYFGNVKKDVFLSRAYKYNSCLEMALSSEDVDERVYKNLINAVRSNIGAMHRYIADRKKILGYDKLYFYDVYAPLVSDVEVKMNYDDAYDYVVKGLAPLGAEYQQLLRRGHDERWIDVEETEGKRSGAYSTGCYGVHPFVLLNYKPTISDIFTIAHEMGHSLHTYFSSHNQPYAKSDYKIFVAEVASTVNEVLLLKYMLADTEDVNLRRYLLNYYLDTIRGTLHRQTMFAEFEYEAHTLAERGEPLTKEVLCDVYGRIGKEYYGDAIEHDNHISCEWSRIPHFYRAFYVYKYATGITAAINIAHRILSEGEEAVKDYFKFLSGGSSTDPVSLLKLAGVDLESEQPFRFAMNEFAETLDEFEKMMKI